MNAAPTGTRYGVSCPSLSAASSKESGANYADDMFGAKPLKITIRNNTCNNSSSVIIKAPVVKKHRRSAKNLADPLSNIYQASVRVASPQTPKMITPKKKKKKNTTPNFQTLDLPVILL